MHDIIVIGAGYAGLAAAALLQKHGFKVLLLESHIAVGGCAGYFSRRNFTFDAGATTFSGLRADQPVGRLFKELEIAPRFKKLDPGMGIFLGDKFIIRHAEKDAWIRECETHFGMRGQRNLWNELYAIEQKVWGLLNDFSVLPPSNISDYFTLLKTTKFTSLLKGAQLLPGLLRPFDTLLEKHGLLQNKLFKKFCDEQLLISTQSTSASVPYVTAAMGLTYPSETYYPIGGMAQPARDIAEIFKKLGGTLLFRQQVLKIEQKPGSYEVFTKKGKFAARGLISSAPVWNMAKLTEGNIQQYFLKEARKTDFAWGAFVMYFAVEDIASIETAYYQIHTREQIPHCDSGSMFVSFSLPDDILRAPAGWRTVTISTHTRVERWQNMEKLKYIEQKRVVEEFLLKEFDHAFKDCKTAKKQLVLTGSPTTFDFYTKRESGFVGGIPHSVENNLLTMTPNVTPFKNLYVTGDTTFPGQGTPAVILSAMNTVERIVRSF
ncbi:MAG TPA: NAD(P)/FAD-dependent oxidoreductase [Patescibacteria group bacterium]|nr:NAD(P)/FAD-dependent oxidoreductase [Patescibacteria group bacterium]